jgi:hypothetical protein
MSAQEARLRLKVAQAQLMGTSPSGPQYPDLLKLIEMLKLMLETYGETAAATHRSRGFR